MKRFDWLAFFLAALAVAINGWIANHIFEGLPHLEDEFAYVWQAQVIARGELTTPSPPNPKSFLVPFVVDYNGQRFGKYPLGWPVVLSLGTNIGAKAWVNPLLAGLGVWLIYLLGKRTLGEGVGLLAAGLTLSSPFFLMNSSVVLSHPWGLVLTTFFTLAWLDMTDEQTHLPGWLPPLGAGLTLGILALSRPLTALGVAIPFGIHGLILLGRGPRLIRRRVLTVGIIALMVGSLHFAWQYAVTGDPLRNPYTLWWEYDRLGFGPGHGVREQGHTLKQAWWNTRHSLNAGLSDLFGWGKLSWIFLPFGLWAVRRERRLWLLIALFPILVLIYATYWVGAWLFGPRYYYEALPALSLLTAAGIAWLAGWPLKPGERYRPRQGWRKARPLAAAALLTLLVAANTLFYIPARIGGMHNLFGVSRTQLAPFLTTEARALTPALILVHPHNWREYDVLLELSNPFFDSPFVFAYSRGAEKDTTVIEMFPERSVYHYYPDEPWKFYTGPREE